MMESVTVSGRFRHIDGHHMGDEVTGVTLTIHAPTRPDGLMAERTGTLAVSGDPTFAQRHHDKTFMFFAEQGVVFEPCDLRITNGTGTIKLTIVPTVQPV
jgi:hypothetical protein